MVPTNVMEAATLHKSVKAACTCGHYGVFAPLDLWWHFERKGWDDRLTSARMRFWCRVCRSRNGKKVRPARLELVEMSASDVRLPMPDDRTWKRVLSRLR